MRVLARYILIAALMIYLMRQVRKPTKWVGRFFARAMNESHSGLTDWGLSHIPMERDWTALDVGCGGGATVKKLACLASRGAVCGVDYAEGSVAASRARCKELIEEGRAEIQAASVSHLPFPENKFDLVTAIETQYYWPNPVADMREILRVLKPAGKLVVIAETYKGGRFDKLHWPVMWLLRSSHLSAADQREFFEKSGYTDVQVFEESRKGWICVVGSKPEVSSVVTETAEDRRTVPEPEGLKT